MTAKQQVIAMIQSLPDDWSVEEIEYYLYMRKRIERSVRELCEQQHVTHQELQRQVLQWKSRLMASAP
jgi:hypothetical protein